MEKELVSLTVNIAGRPYPLKVQEGEDTVIRTVVDKLNGKLEDLQKSYPRQDKLDYLSMTLLTYAVDLDKKQPESQTVQVAEAAPIPASAPVVERVEVPVVSNQTPPEVIDRLCHLDKYLDELLSPRKVVMQETL
jgi:cell division protein ZapA (FtsZ GTPase activity inhibitor)